MLLRSLLLGALALHTSALGVPTQLQQMRDNFLEVHSPEFLKRHPYGFIEGPPNSISELPPFHSFRDVPCPKCPFPAKNRTYFIPEESYLMFNFSVEDNAVLANGQRIFPPVPLGPIYTIQYYAEREISDPFLIGYALEVIPKDPPLSYTPCTEWFEVRIDLAISSHDGCLFMPGGAHMVNPDVLSFKQCHANLKCLKEILGRHIDRMWTAAKDRFVAVAHKAIGRCPVRGAHDMPPFRGLHGHFESKFGSPQYQKYHGHHQAFAHTCSRVLRSIVVPAILSVLAGLTASAIGVLVGQVVVFLWRRYRGTNSEDHKASWGQGEAREKEGLMESAGDVDVLPEYTEVEAFTERSMDVG